MADQAEILTGPSWFKARLKRHIHELFRLALPAVLMRLGILSIAMIDVAMVGHYATEHLAWLNLANTSVIMFSIIVTLGLLTGILINTSNAFGEGDKKECGRVWRRSLPLTGIIGVILVMVLIPTPYYFLLLGQTPHVAHASGEIVQILALGLPAHALFIACSMFLEGIKRAEVGFWVMFVANIVNAFFDYGLIYGAFGMPELGAFGAAWTSTIVRIVMGLGMLGYIWFSPSTQAYGVREPHGQRWREWADQRRMGYATAISLAAEAIAFAALSIFAGWISTEALAGHGVVYQVLGLPIAIAIGVGVAASVRTGIANGRGDHRDTILASMTGMLLTLVISIILAAIILTWRGQIIGIFTGDQIVINLLGPLTIIFTLGMIFDAFQMTLSSILRGLKETWWPTFLQTATFIGVMLPACYVLAFTLERGFRGLLEGTAFAVLVSSLLLIIRYVWLIRRL